MRKQYHFWPGEQGLDAWDVDRLIDLSRHLPAITVDPKSIPEVETAYWSTGPDERLTVRDVIQHFILIQLADFAHPIILGPDGRVMDGMHRIARSLIDGRSSIQAVQFKSLPDPDFRDCRPEDLPY